MTNPISEELLQRELELGHGAQRAPVDERNFSFDEMAAGAPQIDWNKGYDVRNVLMGDIRKKNQVRSYSCVGQGWSYQKFALDALEMTKKYSLSLDDLRKSNPAVVPEQSAKAIYSQISLGPTRGAFIVDGARLLVNFGSMEEPLVPSNKPDGSCDEDFMLEKNWLTEEAKQAAKKYSAKEYRIINARNDMDMFAQAIMQGFGVVGGVIGSNGHGWGYADEPTVPNPGEATWGHCLFYGAFGTDEKGKFIATPNSWGDYVKGDWFDGAPAGIGWQKLRAEYFTNQWQFDPWVLVDKPNEETPKPEPVVPTYKHYFGIQVKKGDRSEEVKHLQRALVLEKLLDPKNVTGYYGDLTQGAVKAFMLRYSIASKLEIEIVGGRYIGPKTRAKLNALYNK